MLVPIKHEEELYLNSDKIIGVKLLQPKEDEDQYMVYANPGETTSYLIFEGPLDNCKRFLEYIGLEFLKTY